MLCILKQDKYSLSNVVINNNYHHKISPQRPNFKYFGSTFNACPYLQLNIIVYTYLF